MRRNLFSTPRGSANLNSVLENSLLDCCQNLKRSANLNPVLENMTPDVGELCLICLVRGICVFHNLKKITFDLDYFVQNIQKKANSDGEDDRFQPPTELLTIKRVDTFGSSVTCSTLCDQLEIPGRRRELTLTQIEKDQ